MQQQISIGKTPKPNLLIYFNLGPWRVIAMKRRPPRKVLFTYMLKYNAVQWTTKRLLQIPTI